MTCFKSISWGAWRGSHGQNHPGDHESDAAEGLFERQTKERPKTAGSPENRKDERNIA